MRRIEVIISVFFWFLFLRSLYREHPFFLVLLVFSLVSILLYVLRCPHGKLNGKNGRCKDCKFEKLMSEWKIKEKERLNLIRQGELDKVRSNNKLELKRFRERAFRDLRQLRVLSPSGFERAVSELYKVKGYSTVLTPPTGDKGKDIILKKNDQVTYVECKKFDFKNKVGRPLIQKLYASMEEDNIRWGIFITTSSFTSDAVTYVNDLKIKKNIEISLVDGVELVKLMSLAYPDKGAEYFSFKCEECSENINVAAGNKLVSLVCSQGHKIRFY